MLKRNILIAFFILVAGAKSSVAFNNNGVMGGVVPFFQIVTGFTDEVWTAMTGNIPGYLEKAGLVDRMNKIRNVVAASLSMSCSEIPTSGSTTATDGGTITYGTPTHSAPSSFTKTGAFQKKITYTGTYAGPDGNTYSISDAKEFYCDGSSSSFDILIIRDSAGTLKGHFETFYEKTETVTNFQAFIPSGSVGTSKLAFALKIIPADTQFKLWVSQSNTSSSKYGGYRVAAATNYSTQKTSLYYTELSTSQPCSPGTEAAFAALDWAKSISVSTTTPGASASSSTCTGSTTDFIMQGCMNNYDATASDITSATLCPGLELSAPSAPGLDSSADFTMAWVAESMTGKLVTP